MSRRSDMQAGFSMVELLISAVVLGIMSGAIYLFFGPTVSSFFKIQETSIDINDKTTAMYRIAQVLRTGTTISEATSTSLTIYAYFSPQDSVLSKVRYYYSHTDKTLKVDRIRAVGTAPNYTYPTANTETKLLLNKVALSGEVFSYADANGGTGPFMLDTYKDIKSIAINFDSPTTHRAEKNQMKIDVELRNRKTNL